MERAGWVCLYLLALPGLLRALPGGAHSLVSNWLPATDEGATLSLEEELSDRDQGLLLPQAPRALQGARPGSGLSKAGPWPSSFTSRGEAAREVLLGKLPRNALLSRWLAADRRPLRKRGGFSECFWKYCV